MVLPEETGLPQFELPPSDPSSRNFVGPPAPVPGEVNVAAAGGISETTNTNEEPTLEQKAGNLVDKSLDSLGEALKLDYGEEGDDLHFPLSLKSDTTEMGSVAKELMRISIVSRDHMEKKNIWLLCPPGISIPDGVEYNQVSLGTLGGRALQAAGDIYDATQGKKAWGDVGSVADLVAASTVTAIKSSGSALGEKGMMTAGLTANPYSHNAFTGSNIRTFEFAFKMVAESRLESQVIKLI